MRTTPSHCPECGNAPKLVLEKVYAETHLQPADANGEIDFNGHRGIDILWDSLTPEVIDGKVTLRCAAYHVWLADMKS